MRTVWIGIDDTDNPHSPGTGHLARALSAECARRGLRPLGVTRHQFLVDPRIPYTSHNSGACVGVAVEDGNEAVAFAFDFVARRSAPGSDPGVCVAAEGDVCPTIVEFGGRAAQEVLTIDETVRLCEATTVELRGLGGTGQGVIGALGSVGQRCGGEAGRYIDLPGLRDLHGKVDAEALTRLGIALEHDSSTRCPAPGDSYATLNWVRPRLVHGQPVLFVEWSTRDYVWLPVDRKKSGPHAESNRR